MVAIFSVRLRYLSWSCRTYQPAGIQLWWVWWFAVYTFLGFFLLHSGILRSESTFFLRFLSCLLLDFTRLGLINVHGRLSTAKNLQFLHYVILSQHMWWACGKGDIKNNRKEKGTLLFSFKKYTHITLNWLVLLSAQAHAHSSPAFQKEMKQLTFYFAESQCLQLQMLHPTEGIAPEGLHSHPSKVQLRTGLGSNLSPLPARWAAWCWTEADLDTLLLGQIHLLQAVPKLGRSGHMKTSVQRGLCQAHPEHWHTSTAQKGNFCAPQLLVLVISQLLFSQGKHISYQSNPWGDFLCSSPSWSSVFLFSLCSRFPSLL